MFVTTEYGKVLHLTIYLLVENSGECFIAAYWASSIVGLLYPINTTSAENVSTAHTKVRISTS